MHVLSVAMYVYEALLILKYYNSLFVSRNEEV